MSKSLNDLFEEISQSESLKKEFTEALSNKETVKKFLENNACDASIEEAKNFLIEKSKTIPPRGELTVEELEQAAGGTDITFLCIWTTLVMGGVLAAEMADNYSRTGSVLDC